MQILVGVPSLNEADSIAHVTAQIDKGLKSTFGSYDCTIVNIDSDSADGTSEKFKSTRTWARKISIVLRQRPVGKGRNLLKFFRYAQEQQADGVATFDADVTSIHPEWVEALLAPIVSGYVDYVVPCYRRSRFEGSTTNHFAFPLMYGFCGIDVRQPIAGDFGVGSKLIKELSSRPITPDILGYGIDMALSMTAGTAGLRISEVSLGDKKHKPSFGKIEKIFKEEAAGGIEIIRGRLPSQEVVLLQERACSIADWGNYNHHHEAISLAERLSTQVENLTPIYSAWLGHGFRPTVSNSLELSTDEWTELLSACIAYAKVNPTISSSILAEQLTPAFVIRAITMWNYSVHKPATLVEQELLSQSQIFRRKLCERVSPKSERYMK